MEKVIKNKFSKRIKEQREELQMSQEKFAEYLGYNRNNISSWEAIGKEPNYDVLINIAQKLDVTTDYLLGLDDGY